ncbi:MAG TPA: UpxY family transcription antiterminator [Candidatus Sulfotelmatobacter sp.]|nr:UpxY family transcription antiterminator [Candidatus Sulfotelmatobacter sp.]
MSASNHLLELSQAISPLPAVECQHWYALHTRPRHEKMVSHRLAERGVTTYLPLITEVRRWSDRKKSIQLPLFGGYVFAKFVPHRDERLRVLRVDGVLDLVGSCGEGSPIPDTQIDAVRTLTEKNVPWSAYPYLAIGQRVRITSGALYGVEGILVGRNGDRSLVISVNAIQRSLSVRVEGYQLEAVR